MGMALPCLSCPPWSSVCPSVVSCLSVYPSDEPVLRDPDAFLSAYPFSTGLPEDLFVPIFKLLNVLYKPVPGGPDTFLSVPLSMGLVVWGLALHTFTGHRSP